MLILSALCPIGTHSSTAGVWDQLGPGLDFDNARRKEPFMKRWFVTGVMVAAFCGGMPTAKDQPIFHWPWKYVPISEFVRKTSAGTDTFVVKKDVLKYVDSLPDAGVGIAYLPNGSSSPSRTDQITIDTAHGFVIHTSSTLGKYVVVTNAFKNDLPITTMWDQSLNGGRGGPSYSRSAVDGIDTLDLDTAAGTSTTFLSSPGHIYNPVNDSFEYVDTNTLALFSGDTMRPLPRVHGYERYIGEDYSILKVTDLFAMYLSNLVLTHLRYPVVFKNAPIHKAKNLYQGVPAFQIINCHRTNHVSVHATEPLLVTFVLPPYWHHLNDQHYPVVYSSYYDLNAFVYSPTFNSGYVAMQKQAAALSAGYRTPIFVFDNGGGAVGPRSTQESYLYNLVRLFFDTKYGLRGDTDSIITYGFSRGALAALMAAGNPKNGSAYRVGYAISTSPPLKTGDIFLDNYYTTSPGIADGISASTGYSYAWKPQWQDASGTSGARLSLLNLTGDSTKTGANYCSPYRDGCINKMADDDTKLLLYTGTHDVYWTYYQNLNFVEKARSAGVTVAMDIAYRAGHRIVGGARLQPVLASVCKGEAHSVPDTVTHTRYGYTGGKWQWTKFSPSTTPTILEAPSKMVKGEKFFLNVHGEPGSRVWVHLCDIDDTQWESNENIVITDTVDTWHETLDTNGIETPSGFAYAKKFFGVSSSLDTGYYAFRLEVLKPDSVSREEVTTPAPYKADAFVTEVRAQSFGDMAGDSVRAILAPDYKSAWGLSEY